MSSLQTSTVTEYLEFESYEIIRPPAYFSAFNSTRHLGHARQYETVDRLTSLQRLSYSLTAGWPRNCGLTSGKNKWLSISCSPKCQNQACDLSIRWVQGTLSPCWGVKLTLLLHLVTNVNARSYSSTSSCTRALPLPANQTCLLHIRGFAYSQSSPTLSNSSSEKVLVVHLFHDTQFLNICYPRSLRYCRLIPHCSILMTTPSQMTTCFTFSTGSGYLSHTEGAYSVLAV